MNALRVTGVVDKIRTFVSKWKTPPTLPSGIPDLEVSDYVVDDKVTHTGQKFEKGDKRLVRFINSTKLVNPNVAIDLIAAVPPEPCKERVVYCIGGGGPLGHPKVYINLDKPGNHSCGYCGLRFYKEDSH